MSERKSRWRGPDRRALMLWLAYLVAAIATLALIAAGGPGGVPRVTTVALALSSGAFATIGLLVVSRQGSNPIGWLFCVIGLGMMLGPLGEEYVRHGLDTDPGSLPFPELAAWLVSWLFGASVLLNLFVLLLFPTGRPPSPRWRGLVWLAVATEVIFVSSSFIPGPLPLEFVGVVVENPFGSQGLGPLLLRVGEVGSILLPVLLIGGVASLIVRARRAAPTERQQLKWIASGAALMVGVNFFLNPLVSAALPELANLPFALGIGIFPVMTGLAILRWRLYDIDVVINRTLVYGSLTVLLGSTYAGLVLVLGRVLGPVTGTSDLAVAGSTLVVAALFGPARRRTQVLIDRRFDRARYDAARTLEALSSRLRHQLDPAGLERELLSAAETALLPKRASVTLLSQPFTERDGLGSRGGPDLVTKPERVPDTNVI